MMGRIVGKMPTVATGTVALPIATAKLDHKRPPVVFNVYPVDSVRFPFVFNSSPVVLKYSPFDWGVSPVDPARLPFDFAPLPIVLKRAACYLNISLVNRARLSFVFNWSPVFLNPPPVVLPAFRGDLSATPLAWFGGPVKPNWCAFQADRCPPRWT